MLCKLRDALIANCNKKKVECQFKCGHANDIAKERSYARPRPGNTYTKEYKTAAQGHKNGGRHDSREYINVG